MRFLTSHHSLRALVLTIASIAMFGGSGLTAQEPILQRFERTEPHMGTSARIVLYAPDETVASAALDAAFAIYPTVRGYLLDDAGALRAHVTVFVDGEVVRDRTRLAGRIAPTARIDVLQALSGG